MPELKMFNTAPSYEAPMLNDKLADKERIAWNLIDRNSARNDLFRGMDKFHFLEWEWPTQNVPNWIRVTAASDPYDALRSAVQILSAVEPRVKVHPVTEEISERETANNLEKGLRWFWWLASKRSQSDLVGSIVQSACQYAMVAIQLDYLPVHNKKFGKNTQMKYNSSGPFVVAVRNPKNVYPVYTDYGLAEVLFTKVYTLTEFLAFFGEEKYHMLVGDEKDDKGQYITVYEHTDIENSFIWARRSTIPTDRCTDRDSVNGVVIYDEKHGLGFIPWVIRQRGPGLFYEPQNNLTPLLYSVYKSKHWDTQNIVLSLLISEVIAHTGSPRIAVFSDNSEAVTTDYGSPDRRVDASSDDKILQLSPPEIDSGMSAILDMLGGMIGKETVARMIQNPEMKADVPFSSMSLIFQLGANTLNPFKALSEDTIAEVLEKMLLYIHSTGTEVLTFSKDKATMGQQIVIKPGMFDPKNLFIEVTLTAEVPTDYVQKVNGAGIAVSQLDYSKVRALEDIGVPDPETVIREHEEETLKDAKLQAKVKEIMGMVDLKLASMQQAMQMMQQQQQAMQSQQQPQMQGGDMSGGVPMGDSGMATPGLPEQENISGPGFAPNMGGMPPITGSPNAARFEGATGSDRTGGQTGGI